MIGLWGDFFGKGIEMPAQVDKEKCTGCESCVEECPSEAISMDEGKAKVNPEACIDCGVCIDACPEQAISMQ
jgi:heterodisulfide reductase subunit A-like polyferredoxin